jgi:predicted dehydrogenase
MAFRVEDARELLELAASMGTNGAMHVQGWDWGPAGVDVADHDQPTLKSECKNVGEYHWVGGARYVARCMLTGEPSLIQPEHALHLLEDMNACHESQQTGRRVEVKSTFKWPIFG